MTTKYKTELTSEGILMREGMILGDRVNVVLNEGDNSVRINYVDEYNVQQTVIKTLNDEEDISLFRNDEGEIESILSNNSNWYLFWSNEYSDECYGECDSCVCFEE